MAALQTRPCAIDLTVMRENKMIMYVNIYRCDDKYEARIYENNSVNSTERSLFKTTSPLERDELNDILLSFGFNQRDIYEAFHIADGTEVNIKHPLFQSDKSNE